jgi:drug/metabolite transporter (DMT)-like permease
VSGDADAAGAASRHRLTTLASFAIIYVFWGSTFLATRLGVRDLPPLLFSAARSYLASILLFVVAIVMKERFPRTAREWGYMLLLSLLMIAISNGCSTTAIKHIPSNEAALLTASLALWMAALGAIGPRGHDLPPRSIVGLLLGLAGVALLVWPRESAAPGHLGWQLLVLAGGFSWAVGSILYRDAHLTVGPVAFNSLLMFLGATGSFCGGVALGQLPQWHWEPRGMLALLYLAVFGSAVSYTAYAWLMKNARTDRVATFAYVNPAIATVLGWIVLDERLGGLQIAGTLVILLGVALVTLPSRGVRY